MLKSELRELGFSEEMVNPKQSIIHVLWVILALTMIAGTVACAYAIVGDNVLERRGAWDPLGAVFAVIYAVFYSLGGVGIILAYMTYLIFWLLAYLFLKLIMTIIVCSDKHRSIKLKVLKDRGVPVCFCLEALKVWQTVLIYVVPFVAMYGVLFTSCIFGEASAEYTFIIIFLSVFMSFDLTAVIYVIFYKIKYGIDYISIDHHVYEVTFFNKPYIRFSQKVANAKRKKNKSKGKLHVTR